LTTVSSRNPIACNCSGDGGAGVGVGVDAGELAVVEVAGLVVAVAEPLATAVALVADGTAVVAAAEGIAALVDGADVSVADEPPPHAIPINSTTRLKMSAGSGVRREVLLRSCMGVTISEGC